MVAIDIRKHEYNEMKELTNDKPRYDPEKVSFADVVESAWNDAKKYREAKRKKKAIK